MAKIQKGKEVKGKKKVKDGKVKKTEKKKRMENRRLNKNTVVEENESELVVDKNGIARSMGLIQYMAVSICLISKYIFIK